MKQLFLNSDSIAEVVEVPAPAHGANDILVLTHASLISTGTETAGYDTGSFVTRNLTDTGKITQSIAMLSERGISRTLLKVREKRHQLTPRGYSGSGVVVAAGRNVRRFSIGDRVAFAGAPHAEVVAVNENLAARIPDGVSFDDAAFGAVACIALHGVRLGEPTLGETAIVVGLGLVGLLTVQFARASGLRVIGVDPVAARRALAADMGAQVIDPTEIDALHTATDVITAGRGADIAYLCASTKDSRVTNAALRACRDRARAVMIGDMGLNLDRGPLFKKEISVRVSRSYGPGRYDAAYESKGLDYPIGFVRWTEGRNLSCFLDMVASGAIQVRGMIANRVRLDEAARAYAALTSDARPLAVVLTYPVEKPQAPASAPRTRGTRVHSDRLRIGIIGCGAFVTTNLIPEFAGLDAEVYAVANRSAAGFARLRAHVPSALMTTDADEVLADPNVDAVIVATRHNLHAMFASAAIKAGKPAHIEKPLALTLADALRLSDEVRTAGALLTIGFNRRFAPYVVAMRNAIHELGAPRHILYRVNAPLLPLDHWTLDPVEGGGRIVGEACHFIDLVCYLAGSPPISASIHSISGNNDLITAADNASISLTFANGDVGTIVYSAQGNPSLAKERLEVFTGGRAFVLDDFKSLSAFGAKVPSPRGAAGDKGFKGHLRNFFDAVRGRAELVTTVEAGVVVAQVLEGQLPGMPVTPFEYL